MSITKLTKYGLALALMVLGLVGVVLMFQAESATLEPAHFDNYFQWALGAGITFVAVGLALNFADRSDDGAATSFENQKR